MLFEIVQLSIFLLCSTLKATNVKFFQSKYCIPGTCFPSPLAFYWLKFVLNKSCVDYWITSKKGPFSFFIMHVINLPKATYEGIVYPIIQSWLCLL